MGALAKLGFRTLGLLASHVPVRLDLVRPYVKFGSRILVIKGRASTVELVPYDH